jgi:branched-chain amino acid transport system substrate-binding protein
MRFALKSIAVCALLAGAGASFAQKGETVKIAWLDPLSGLMAAVGTNQLKTTQFLAEEFNKKNASGVKFEIIGIDNKLSPQETTAALRSARTRARATSCRATARARRSRSSMRSRRTMRATRARNCCT